MLKKLFICIALFSSLSVFSQNFSSMYPFTDVISGSVNTGSTDPTPSPSAAGVVFGAFSSVGTYTAPSASNVFCFGGWGQGATNGNDINFTGALDTGLYFKVIITPQSSYSVTLNSVTFNMARATAGPRHWAVRSNKDNYTNNIAAGVSVNPNLSVVTGNVFLWNSDSYTVAIGKQEKGCNLTLGGTNFSSQITPFEFRFYAWDSETTPGTFRIDTVIFNGLATIYAGVNELSQDFNSALKIYPNPTNDGIVYLDLKNVNYSRIEVLNVFGSTIVFSNRDQQNDEKIKLNLSDISTGIYFLRLISEERIYIKRFTISK